MKKEHVTNHWELKLDVKPTAPPPLVILGRKSIKYIGSLLVKILGPILGFGRAKHKVVEYPELFLKMKDGTRLATSVYVPKKVYKKKLKAPTILIRLPYWKDGVYKIFGYAFASYGYVLIMQDCRGCAHSEGFNFFLQTEREDGLETLEWIKKQYWYNGKIGMAGGSYFGMTQLCVSWDNDLLTCIAPAICSISNLWRGYGGLKIHSLTISIYRIMINISANREKPLVDILTKEILELYTNPKYALYNDPIEKKGKYLKFSDFKGKTAEECVDLLAEFYKIPKWDLSKRNFKIYFKFLDDFLKLEKDIENMPGLLDLDMSKWSQPAFIQAGWQDMFIEQQLKDFIRLKEYSDNENIKASRMVIGPWAHADKGHPEGSMIDFLKYFLNLHWYRYWLDDKKDSYPDIDKPAIKYWTIGKNDWDYTDIWPPANISYKRIYLHSNGNANSLKGDGILSFQEPGEDEKPDKYIFDPMNPVITGGGRNLGIKKGCFNQKKIEKRKDVLVYTSEILSKPIQITGPVKMELYASSSAKDTDFMVKLVDVYPKGKALNVIDGGIRARFRNGENKPPSLIEPNKIYKYEINVGNISILFRKGHRIRVEISSSNFPRFDINSNMGGEGKPGDYKIAHQTIYHDKEHPSCLILPIFK
ncbi:MAG: CocE/NonD family hydrolase [Promethearchaeota archaeon]